VQKPEETDREMTSDAKFGIFRYADRNRKEKDPENDFVGKTFTRWD
jgi:hypothetical protein